MDNLLRRADLGAFFLWSRSPNPRAEGEPHMARMLVSDDEAARRCGVCSRPEDAVEAAHGAAGLQPSRAAPLVEMPGRDGLLPRYTLGERSRELRQRSVLLLWWAHCLPPRCPLAHVVSCSTVPPSERSGSCPLAIRGRNSTARCWPSRVVTTPCRTDSRALTVR